MVSPSVVITTFLDKRTHIRRRYNTPTNLYIVYVYVLYVKCNTVLFWIRVTYNIFDDDCVSV